MHNTEHEHKKGTQITGQSLWTCIEIEKHVLLLRKGLKVRPVMNVDLKSH